MAPSSRAAASLKNEVVGKIFLNTNFRIIQAENEAVAIIVLRARNTVQEIFPALNKPLKDLSGAIQRVKVHIISQIFGI